MADSKEKPRDLNLNEILQCDDTANQILVGPCPKCESNNVHNCEAQSPILEKTVMFEAYRQYGSNCPIAKKLDNPGVGHCDDCGFLWCLDCGSEVTVEDPNCGHWEICNNCPEIDQDSEYPECSYSGWENNCPKIITSKNEKKE